MTVWSVLPTSPEARGMENVRRGLLTYTCFVFRRDRRLVEERGGHSRGFEMQAGRRLVKCTLYMDWDTMR
jgi:hypothetical protein